MDDERRLRDALRAFEAACQAVIDATRTDPSEVAALIGVAEARLADAQAVLDRLRKRQTPP